MHWDRDCKYNKSKTNRSARTLFVEADCSSEDILAELEYERSYEENLQLASAESNSDSEPEEESESAQGNVYESNSSGDSDF